VSVYVELISVDWLARMANARSRPLYEPAIALSDRGGIIKIIESKTIPPTIIPTFFLQFIFM